MSPSTDTVKPRPPRGITAIGIFLLFGAAMACLAGTSLTWRGTALDRMWALNPRAYKDLAPFGKAVGIPFLCRRHSCHCGRQLVETPTVGMAAGGCNHRDTGLE